MDEPYCGANETAKLPVVCFAADALKKLEERGIVIRFIIGRRYGSLLYS